MKHIIIYFLFRVSCCLDVDFFYAFIGFFSYPLCAALCIVFIYKLHIYAYYLKKKKPNA